MKYKTLFRLALKAIGVLLVIQAVPQLVMSGFQVFAALSSLAAGAGFGFWPFYVGYAVGNALQIALGFYLFFGGAWIVNRAIPSNRCYCHECADELRGLPAEGACPECGTPYRLPAAREPEAGSGGD